MTKRKKRVVSIKNDDPIPVNKSRIIAHDLVSRRMIVAVGNQRFALDFTTKITRLDPVIGDRPASVLPIRKHEEKGSTVPQSAMR